MDCCFGGRVTETQQQEQAQGGPETGVTAESSPWTREVPLRSRSGSVESKKMDVDLAGEWDVCAGKHGSATGSANLVVEGDNSRRRDCHFDDTPFFIPIETANKGRGGARSRMTVSPTATCTCRRQVALHRHWHLRDRQGGRQVLATTGALPFHVKRTCTRCSSMFRLIFRNLPSLRFLAEWMRGDDMYRA